MLEKRIINTLKLIPEVDMEKASKLKFTNSDKLAHEVNLGGNRDISDVAFLATQVAVDPDFNRVAVS